MEQEKKIEQIKRAILKSLLEEGEQNDSQQLKEWLESSQKNRELYNRFFDRDYLEEESRRVKRVSAFLKGSATLKGSTSYKRERRVRGTIIRWGVAAAAAVVTLLLLIGRGEEFQPHHSKISLMIDGKRPLLLTEAEDLSRLNKMGITLYNDTLDYSGATLSKKSRHKINIPKRRSITLKFGDGTTAVLNSESNLNYPANFLKSDRVVELDGEAFFHVVNRSNYPFVVKNELQEIVVKGTSFNVKGYSYEREVTTTLVTGAIILNYLSENDVVKSEELHPNEQFILKRGEREGEIREVDVNRFISWKEGLYLFESERLEDIMNNISRWYGVTVMFKSDQLKEIVLTGRLRRDETPNHLITTIGNLNKVEIIRSNNLIMIKEK